MDGVPGEVRCGSYEVFENREARSGRRIPLKIVVLAAEKKDAPDPLFIFAGGPGQAAIGNVKFFARTFAGVRRSRDIVLVDQRGTGGSNGLECDLYSKSTQAHLGELFPAESVARCAEGWKTRADLRFYTSEIAMAEIDEVRAAMGYERINIFGTSYGTRAAQVYMRQFPDRVRTVIMKGVTQIVTPLTIAMARDAQRSWDILCEDCAADPACHAAFPNLKEDFQAVFERLEQNVETDVEVAKDKKDRVTITRAAIAPTIRTLLQAVENQSELPLLIHQAATGNFAPLAQAALTIRRGFPKAVSLGVFLAITAIEDVAITDAAEVTRASMSTFLRDDYFTQLQRAAAMLPRKEMPPGYREPVRSEIPTLLISGHLDPATPASAAEDVAKHLPKSKHVVVRYGSHAYGGMSPCVDNIMADFIGRGSVEGLDIACVEQIRRPAFVTTEKP
ncbi:MAG: alpha/beta hydrolase, partial [Verrucomicrobiaceae bacterium]|nr:alpha/beta hydrolase [Verrucomicrobiaceae bacterium]